MDENEYRSTYHSLNTIRCVFEKSILTQHCACRFHERFNLAEREGIRCTQKSSQQNCKTFLKQCRQQARFALRVPEIIGNLLPHNKEVQLQKGALMGLAPELPNQPGTEISDIYSLIEKALYDSSGDLLEFPYYRLVSSISSHPLRPKRRRSRRKN
jgi:hypothetical protein